jgi:hypothetical protein
LISCLLCTLSHLRMKELRQPINSVAIAKLLLILSPSLSLFPTLSFLSLSYSPSPPHSLFFLSFFIYLSLQVLKLFDKCPSGGNGDNRLQVCYMLYITAVLCGMSLVCLRRVCVLCAAVSACEACDPVVALYCKYGLVYLLATSSLTLAIIATLLHSSFYFL